MTRAMTAIVGGLKDVIFGRLTWLALINLVVAATMTASVSGLVSGLGERKDERTFTSPRLDVVELYPYVPYVQYLLPGSVVMSIFMMVMIGGGIIFIDDKARGLHEGYLVTPIRRLELIAGFNISGTIKAVLAGFVLMTIGSLIAGVPDPFEPMRLLSAGAVHDATSNRRQGARRSPFRRSIGDRSMRPRLVPCGAGQ